MQYIQKIIIKLCMQYCHRVQHFHIKTVIFPNYKQRSLTILMPKFVKGYYTQMCSFQLD